MDQTKWVKKIDITGLTTASERRNKIFSPKYYAFIIINREITKLVFIHLFILPTQ